MDIGMPVMNGLETIIHIRKFNTKIPIIVQTAYSSDQKSEAFSAGCNDYIRKPVIENELMATIEKYFL
jgi:CheY-like chemotaxis protein